MKDFIKFTVATVVGLLLTFAIIFVLSIITMVGVVSSDNAKTIVQENSVLNLNINGVIEERSKENPFSFLPVADKFDSTGLDEILSAIKNAKEDKNIKGILIQAGIMSSGFASLEEIRAALLDFKESGKFIVAYGDTYTQGLYYLASVADKIMLNPQGLIEWRGLASQPMFYKDLLQKIGIEMQIFKVGTYKSAVEPFVATSMSEANREQVNVFLNSIWGKVCEGVSISRNIPIDRLNNIADNLTSMHKAEEAISCGLADTLIYKTDVRAYLKQLADINEDDKIHLVSVSEMSNVEKSTPRDKSGNIIAVYYAYGEIDGQSSSLSGEQEGIISDKVAKDLRKLEKDDDVKAVVLRVNSPGGSAFGSEQIWYAVTQLKTKKPVIVSMGDYAASGGYYISCAADTIVADPTTLTGSIGIFGMYPNLKGLSDKIGVSFDMVKTNEMSDFGTTVRPMTESEKAFMQTHINNGYDTFLTRVSDGRNIDKVELDKIAQGRVWTGKDALNLKLVDVLGGLDKAIEIATAKAGIESYTLKNYPDTGSILDMFSNKTSDYIKSQIFKSELGKFYQPFRMLERVNKMDPIQARIPFELNIQ